MKNLENLPLLDKLEDFKKYIQQEVVQKCKQQYGEEIYNEYIDNYISDMLENFESQIEIVAEYTLLEDELSYDNYQGE